MANAVFGFIVGLLSTLATICLGYGIIQNKKYKKEREKKVEDLLEEASEIAKAKVDSKSIDELVADSNKRYGPGVANKPEEK